MSNVKLFLYTGGTKGGTEALKDMLAYIQNTTEENAVDADLKKLHVSVKRLKNNKQIGVKYMQMREWMWLKVKEEVEEKVEEAKLELEKAAKKKMEEVGLQVYAAKQEADAAKQQTEQRMLKLTENLLNAVRYDDLRRITQDIEHLEKMLEEYGI